MANVKRVSEQRTSGKYLCDQPHPELNQVRCAKELFHPGDHSLEWTQEPIVPVSRAWMKEFYE